MPSRQFILCALCIVTATFSSCLKPCQCDPPGPMPYLQFKIVNQQGQNLVYGNSRIYNPDSIEVLKNYNNFSVDNASVDRSYKDSMCLAFNFYIPEAKSYIYYSKQAKTDTLEISWIAKEGKCCGEPFTYYGAEGLTLNGQPLQPNNGVYLIVK